MQVVVILGSNLGNKYEQLNEATRRLSIVGQLRMASSFYETAPWGFECKENFLNQVVVFETSLSPCNFLKHCLKIEEQLGRIRQNNSPRYTSRPIDIDILFYDSQILNTPDLIIPHPRLCERNFVLIPLAEILPDFIHPVFQKTITVLQQECPDKLTVNKMNDEQ